MTTTSKTPPQTLKGFRDFLPEEARKRQWLKDRVSEVFEQFGFLPVETPTLEYADLLLGKYGQEADQLVYTFADKGNRQAGLRYDQTVPTARLLTQYQNQLPPFFRRYQIQNVFRADKPQKRRYREFTQCDIDIFGSTSPLADAEVMACTYFAYVNAGLDEVQLVYNDRKVLIATLDQFTNAQVDVFSLIQSVDKLDKQTSEQVSAELVSKGLNAKQATQALAAIEKAEMSENLKQIVDMTQQLGVPDEALVFNPKLARGLDYYTGMIFEVLQPNVTGSLGGGGRYDQLIGQLGAIDIPAVGIAFGFDRMVEVADELGKIPSGKDAQVGTQALVTVFNNTTLSSSLQAARALREAGVSTEVYPAAEDKLQKQLKLANQKQIPLVVIIGDEEAEQNKVTLKDMANGEQELLSVDDLVTKLTTT